MKPTTTSFLKLTSLLAISAAALLSACSKADRTSTGTTTASSSPSTSATAAMTAATSDTWDSLKNYTYDRRAEFAAKTQAMADRLDLQTATAKGDASRRLAEARDELRTAAADVSNATSETWESTKERAGRAWQKAQSSILNVAE